MAGSLVDGALCSVSPCRGAVSSISIKASIQAGASTGSRNCLHSGAMHLPAGCTTIVICAASWDLPSCSCVDSTTQRCNLHALHDERHLAFECPAMQSVRNGYPDQFSPAKNAMQLYMWLRDIVGVAHCIRDCPDVLGALSDAPDDASTSSLSAWRLEGDTYVHPTLIRSTMNQRRHACTAAA